MKTLRGDSLVMRRGAVKNYNRKKGFANRFHVQPNKRERILSDPQKPEKSIESNTSIK